MTSLNDTRIWMHRYEYNRKPVRCFKKRFQIQKIWKLTSLANRFNSDSTFVSIVYQSLLLSSHNNNETFYHFCYWMESRNQEDLFWEKFHFRIALLFSFLQTLKSNNNYCIYQKFHLANDSNYLQSYAIRSLNTSANFVSSSESKRVLF